MWMRSWEKVGTVYGAGWEHAALVAEGVDSGWKPHLAGFMQARPLIGAEAPDRLL